MNPTDTCSSLNAFLAECPIPSARPSTLAPPLDRTVITSNDLGSVRSELNRAPSVELDLLAFIEPEFLVGDMDDVEVEDFGCGPLVDPFGSAEETFEAELGPAQQTPPAPPAPPLDSPSPSPSPPPPTPVTPAQLQLQVKRVAFAPDPVTYLDQVNVGRVVSNVALVEGRTKSILRQPTNFFPEVSPDPHHPNRPDRSATTISTADTPSPHSRDSSSSASPPPALALPQPQPAPKAKKRYFAKRSAGPPGPKPGPALPPTVPTPAPASRPSDNLRKRKREPSARSNDPVPKERTSPGPKAKGRSQPKPRADDEDDEDELEVPAEHLMIPFKVVDQLEDDEASRNLYQIEIDFGGERTATLGNGDVAEFEPDWGTNPKAKWLAVVIEPRALLSDRKRAQRLDGSFKTDKAGRIRYEYASTYVSLRWLYSTWDFNDLKTKNKDVSHLWAGQLRHLGPNERVLSDHFEYYRTGRTVQSQIKCLMFNDRYPASGDSGLVQSATHPLQIVAHTTKHDSDPTPPSFFFGETKEYNQSTGPDQSWAGAVLVRTELALEGERVEVEDEGLGEGEGEPQTKKRRAKEKTSSAQWKHLTFNKFGPRNQPYEFDKVQVYSHLKSTWYTIEDMSLHVHHAAASRTDEPALSPPPSVDGDSPLAPLARLGSDPIVRGGAFGITGNAYLVTKAKELLIKLVLVDADGASSDADGEDEAGGDPVGDGGSVSASDVDEAQDKASLLEEAVVLVGESKVWKGWVDVRRQRRGESGKRLASQACPPLDVNGGERRWVSVADKRVPILSKHEGHVLREWEKNGLWEGK